MNARPASAAMIAAAGGWASLAHPGYYWKDGFPVLERLAALPALGVEAVELEYPYRLSSPDLFSEEDEREFTVSLRATGEELGLRFTRGSDAHRAADLERCVVATGGGAFCSEINRLAIAGSGGVSVFLDVPWEVLRSRLQGATSDRPMFGDAISARGLFDRRLPCYRQATLTVGVTEHEKPEETAERIREALQEVPCVS